MAYIFYGVDKDVGGNFTNRQLKQTDYSKLFYDKILPTNFCDSFLHPNFWTN